MELEGRTAAKGCLNASFTGGKRITSAEEFIANALAWFGDPNPALGSAWSKGERLAALIRRERTLLVLDGMEPLQDPYRGIKDQGLNRLVCELARDHNGLCVITTREPIHELREFPESTDTVNLEQISCEAGRALLRVNGVRGTDLELETACSEFGNHALAINLLAKYLRTIPGHKVHHARSIAKLEEVAEEDGRHPRRVLVALTERLENGAELDLLHIVGLFDRPVDEDIMDALRSKPPIKGLTERLAVLEEAAFQQVLSNLRYHGLLAPIGDHRTSTVDAHPIVRQHFGSKLEEAHRSAFEHGHFRVYRHLIGKADPSPKSIEGLAPLLQAISHGSKTRAIKHALNHTYRARINGRTPVDDREKEFLLTRVLGAHGASLAALAGFFASPWSELKASFSREEEAFIWMEVGFSLRALGQIREAMAPMMRSLQACSDIGESGEFYDRHWMLAEIHLLLGELDEAAKYAEMTVRIADETESAGRRSHSRTILGNVLQLQGKLGDAMRAFDEGHAIKDGRPPAGTGAGAFRGDELALDTISQHPEFFASRTHYNDLDGLIEYLKKAQRDMPTGYASLLSEGWLSVTLARAMLTRLEMKNRGSIQEISNEIERGIDLLRQAQFQDFLVRALVFRAKASQRFGNLNGARRDLDEARLIADASEMTLYRCDIDLGYAELALDQSNYREAAILIERSRTTASSIGYGWIMWHVDQAQQRLSQHA